MADPALSSRPQPKTQISVASSHVNRPSSSPRQDPAAWENGQKAWVDRNLKDLLAAFGTGKRSIIGITLCPQSVTRCIAIEGTEKDLPWNLCRIHERYGPIRMDYEGSDTLGFHWVSGWEVHHALSTTFHIPSHKIGSSKTGAAATDVQRVMICVEMSNRPPLSEKDGALIKSYDEKYRQDHQDKADWVDIPSDSATDGDWIKPNGIPSVANGAATPDADDVEKYRR